MSKNKYFCICRKSDVSKCILQEKDSIKPDDFIDEIGKDNVGVEVSDTTQIERTEDGNTLTWKSDKFKVEGKKLAFYYIQFYDKDEHVPEHDKIMLANKSTYEIPKSIVEDKRHLTILILGLFGKQNDHNFIEINSKATGMEPCKLVIDKLRRYSSQPEVFFGFRAAKTFETCEPVAVKLVPVAQSTDAVSMFAGGQYNRKYLASDSKPASEDVWIAMELCHTHTFDYWVTRHTPTVGYLIDHSQLKICFRHILYGLDHLHSQDIIHGNMNMQNILLSLPHRDRLKIGDYDHVKQNNDNSRNSMSKTDDIELTARMFFKCLCRDDKTDRKPVVEAIDDDIVKSWIDDIASEINKKESDEVDEIGLCEGDKASVYKIMKVIVYNKNPPESKKSFSPLWIRLLQRLAKEITKGLCPEVPESLEQQKQDPEPGNATNAKPTIKDSFMSAYLIMHMVLDKPEAVEILQHPFFWSECKILDFITRMEGIFYKLYRIEQKDIGNDYPERTHKILKRIESKFRSACYILRPNLDWIKELKENIPDRNCECKVSIIQQAENDVKLKAQTYDLASLNRFIDYVSENKLWPEEIKIEDLKAAAKEYLESPSREQNIEGQSYKQSDIKRFLNHKKVEAVLLEHNIKLKETLEKFGIDLAQQIADEKKESATRGTKNKKVNLRTLFEKLKLKNENFSTLEYNDEIIKLENEYWKVPDGESRPRSNIRKFMRCIRNTYAHYYDRRSFESPTHVWNCFGNVIPEMICLLHRAVWLECSEDDLLDDLRQFLLDPNNTLNSLTSDDNAAPVRPEAQQMQTTTDTDA